jgi:hypothetical protein
MCVGGKCVPFHCFDGAIGPNETGVDCGGACPNACELGALCNVDIVLREPDFGEYAELPKNWAMNNRLTTFAHAIFSTII